MKQDLKHAELKAVIAQLETALVANNLETYAHAVETAACNLTTALDDIWTVFRATIEPGTFTQPVVAA